MARVWCYLRGFLEEGQPQSSARLIAVLFCVSACGVAWYGAFTHWDSSSLVLSLSGGTGVSLWQRNKGKTPDQGAG